MASSLLTSSQGMVFATAMAVSGTVILLAFRLQKSFLPAGDSFSVDPLPHQLQAAATSLPRSCISSDEKKEERKKKKKKRVHFAEDVVDPSGNSEEYRRQHNSNYYFDDEIIIDDEYPEGDSSSELIFKKVGGKIEEMPANRMALYNGILRDRVHHRVAYSY